MMVEIAKLLGGDEKGLGYLDPAAYQRTVDTLLANPSTPVITKEPEGAWTHEVWEKAQGTEPVSPAPTAKGNSDRRHHFFLTPLMYSSCGGTNAAVALGDAIGC